MKARLTGVGSIKGGVGKSSISLAMATNLMNAGRKVLLVDAAFGQYSIMNFMTYRAKRGTLEAFANTYATAKTLPNLLDVVDQFDDIIIDCAGSLSKEMKVAARIVDRWITPVIYNPQDFWTLETIVDMVHKENRKRVKEGGTALLRLDIAMNRLPVAEGTREQQIAEIKGAIEAVNTKFTAKRRKAPDVVPALHVLEAPLITRAAYDKAWFLGASITESGLDAKATDEFNAMQAAFDADLLVAA